MNDVTTPRLYTVMTTVRGPEEPEVGIAWTDALPAKNALELYAAEHGHDFIQLDEDNLIAPGERLAMGDGENMRFVATGKDYDDMAAKFASAGRAMEEVNKGLNRREAEFLAYEGPQRPTDPTSPKDGREDESVYPARSWALDNLAANLAEVQFATRDIEGWENSQGRELAHFQAEQEELSGNEKLASAHSYVASLAETLSEHYEYKDDEKSEHYALLAGAHTDAARFLDPGRYPVGPNPDDDPNKPRGKAPTPDGFEKDDELSAREQMQSDAEWRAGEPDGGPDDDAAPHQTLHDLIYAGATMVDGKPTFEIPIETLAPQREESALDGDFRSFNKAAVHTSRNAYEIDVGFAPGGMTTTITNRVRHDLSDTPDSAQSAPHRPGEGPSVNDNVPEDRQTLDPMADRGANHYAVLQAETQKAAPPEGKDWAYHPEHFAAWAEASPYNVTEGDYIEHAENERRADMLAIIAESRDVDGGAPSLREIVTRQAEESTARQGAELDASQGVATADRPMTADEIDAAYMKRVEAEMLKREEREGIEPVQERSEGRAAGGPGMF